MPEGVIQGGWPYVIAAYSFTWIVFVAYTVSLFTKRRTKIDEGEGS